jgi:hypothetical protein
MNTPEGRLALEKLPLEDLIGLTLILAPKVGRVLEAVRAAHGVYVEKPKRGDNNGDQHVWYVEELSRISASGNAGSQACARPG